MPSGYTSEIKKGISFKEFLFTCARAFGATVSLRDEPLSSNLPDEFEPSSYHQDQLKELAKNLKKYNSMSLETANQLFQKEKNENKQKLVKYIKEQKSLKKKYESMLKQVHKWQPPTSEHEELKKFMIEQITSSIKFDCTIYSTIYKTKEKSAKEWLKNKISQIITDQEYHERNHEDEVERTAERSKWVQDLKGSVK